MKTLLYIIAVAAIVFTLGCAGMSRTEQRTLSGGAIGAGGGAALGALVGGSPAVGAGVGGALGAVAGYISGSGGFD